MDSRTNQLAGTPRQGKHPWGRWDRLWSVVVAVALGLTLTHPERMDQQANQWQREMMEAIQALKR